ncbi:unnamed protein product [Ostreobium quekettii]|uniref:Amine oxidase n=1 Tax=Ostreobium quekettii TaxID=121088 RepID=A0A8S1JD45_9CHLO|nr:unnamed protein product [Ostreobium quekettii]|eukprot:evm.model.scf_137.10 EVM.evm.TU.scf_137.10   scf_137:85386-94449(-)
MAHRAAVLLAAAAMCGLGLLGVHAQLPDPVGVNSGSASQIATPAPEGGPEKLSFVPDFCPTGPASDTTEIDEEQRWAVFDQLATHEIWNVLEFSVGEMGWFHLLNSSYNSTDELPGPFDDIIFRVEVLPPPKQEALAYLDGAGPRPDRFARVAVIRGSATPRDVMEYKVGPLPIAANGDSGEGKFERVQQNLSPRPDVLVEKLRKDGQIPYSKRPTEFVTEFHLDTVVSREALFLRDIFKDTTGKCYGREAEHSEGVECGREDMKWLGYPALHANESKRVTHIHWFFSPHRTRGEEFELHGVPISFKVDQSAADPADWFAFDFEYCHQGPFKTSASLLEAYTSGELVKCYSDEWKDPKYDVRWATTSDRQRFRPGSEKSGPRTFQPDGRRFKMTTRRGGGGARFEWLGWQGHVGMRLDSGITLHDIRFRGNRILYELSLQEQYVAYSGYQGGGQVVYFDSYFGIGLNSFPLKRGLDCPEGAEYVSVTKMHGGGEVEEVPDVICVFEEDAQATEWRHTHLGGPRGFPRLDAVRRSTLVIRTVSTIGNYDYIYDVRVRQDASVEVDVNMAGYMESTFFGPNGETLKDVPFGTRVHQYTFANLHDHLSGWKVDLDILGTQNSIVKHEIKVGTWEEALKTVDPDAKAPGWHTSPVVKYVDTSTVPEEFGYKIENSGTCVWTVVNDVNTNRWGQPRGYAIVHGVTTSQLLPDSHPFTKAGAWTKYHLAVTKRRDEEYQESLGIYDMNIPGQPVVSLDDWINGESIVEEDLVAWVMVGLLHVPRSEDVPLISNFGTSFFIKPWNYFEELQSMDVANNFAFEACVPHGGRHFDYHWAWDPQP